MTYVLGGRSKCNSDGAGVWLVPDATTAVFRHKRSDDEVQIANQAGARPVRVRLPTPNGSNLSGLRMNSL